MPQFRVVSYDNPQDFIDACRPFDDSFMNFTLGALLDSLGAAQISPLGRSSPQKRTILAIYDDEQLVVALVKISHDFAWMLGAPRGVEDSLSSTDVAAVMALLVPAIATEVEPKAFDKVIGPTSLVNALLDAWISHMGTADIPVRLLDPFFKSRVSYATLPSLPALSTSFSHHKVQLATSDDIDALVPFYIDFTSHGPRRATSDAAKHFLAGAIRRGWVWVTRLEGQIAGYCAVGRVTPNTIAVRNLYVSPAHRKNGVGEVLTTAVTRLYLGARPLGFDAPASEPSGGVKREVCLNVAEEHVERIYKRCGFLLDQTEPGTTKLAWFHSLFRGVEYP